MDHGGHLLDSVALHSVEEFDKFDDFCSNFNKKKKKNNKLTAFYFKTLSFFQNRTELITLYFKI